MIAQTVRRDGSIWLLYSPSKEPDHPTRCSRGPHHSNDPQGGATATDCRDHSRSRARPLERGALVSDPPQPTRGRVRSVATLTPTMRRCSREPDATRPASTPSEQPTGPEPRDARALLPRPRTMRSVPRGRRDRRARRAGGRCPEDTRHLNDLHAHLQERLCLCLYNGPNEPRASAT